MHVKIGERLLLDFHLDPGWTKKDLYNQLVDELGSKVSSAEKNKYGKFYLKIRGYYDKSIMQDEYAVCDACPYNFKYTKYHEYNALRNEKEPILVLVSKYADFRDYTIFASYFVDKDLTQDNNNVELWAESCTLFQQIIRFFGLDH